MHLRPAGLSRNHSFYINTHGRHQLHLCMTMLMQSMKTATIAFFLMVWIPGLGRRKYTEKRICRAVAIQSANTAFSVVARTEQNDPGNPVARRSTQEERPTEHLLSLQDAGRKQAHAPLQMPGSANAPTVHFTGLAASAKSPQIWSSGLALG